MLGRKERVNARDARTDAVNRYPPTGGDEGRAPGRLEHVGVSRNKIDYILLLCEEITSEC